MTDVEEGAPTRADFAAGVLEFEQVLELFEHHAHSSLGRRALQDLAPRSKPDARRALTRVREMQTLAKAQDLPSFAGVSDPFPAEWEDERAFDEARFVSLRAFLAASQRLIDWFAERTEDVPELAAVAERIPDGARCIEAIDSVLDERGRVRSDASPLLARLGQTARELARKIDERLRALMKRPDVRNVLADGSVHRRGGRPVLVVRAKSSGRVKGIVHDRSQSEQSVFIEPVEVVEAGNRLAEVQADMRREVERILLELTRTLLDERPGIERAADALSDLELAAISASYCAAHDARAALVVGDEAASAGLLLRNARHPLLVDQHARGELAEVVPIDLRLCVDFDMLIITGPNTGGKTLALKTAGLFALLTRCGLPVPAVEGTTLPLFDRIYADIGDEQEIAQSLSTFASHLKRIGLALDGATPNTLVLLDELGGGTDPDEGAALGEAILETLLERKVPTLASTHISKLKELAFRRARAENACTEFDLATLAPRYRLQVGTPGESGALLIARRLGLAPAVVDLAQERTTRRDDELSKLMDEVRISRQQAERVRNEAEDRLEDAQQQRRAAQEHSAALSRREELLEQEAQKGLEERVREALREVERARALVDQLPKASAQQMRERLEALEYHLSGASLSDRRQAFLDDLAKGRLVYVPRYRQRVVIQKVDRKGRTVTVQLGAMRMKVSFDELTEYESL